MLTTTQCAVCLNHDNRHAFHCPLSSTAPLLAASHVGNQSERYTPAYGTADVWDNRGRTL